MKFASDITHTLSTRAQVGIILGTVFGLMLVLSSLVLIVVYQHRKQARRSALPTILQTRSTTSVSDHSEPWLTSTETKDLKTFRSTVKVDLEAPSPVYSPRQQNTDTNASGSICQGYVVTLQKPGCPEQRPIVTAKKLYAMEVKSSAWLDMYTPAHWIF